MSLNSKQQLLRIRAPLWALAASSINKTSTSSTLGALQCSSNNPSGLWSFGCPKNTTQNNSLVEGPWGVRTFASQVAPDPLAIADTVLQQVQVHKLRQLLSDEADQNNRLYIPLSEFTALALSCGAAQSVEEAEVLCGVLQRAGVVLRHQSIVYLRVDEIADMVTMMLPDTSEDAQSKLEKIEMELAEMEDIHKQAERSSRFRTNAILGAGYVFFFVHIVVFIYLTWWELSWDVMEPIAYILQLFYSFIAYTYFLITRGHVMDLAPIKEFWSRRFKTRRIKQLEFNAERYNYLLKLKDRYVRHLEHSTALRV